MSGIDFVCAARHSQHKRGEQPVRKSPHDGGDNPLKGAVSGKSVQHMDRGFGARDQKGQQMAGIFIKKFHK